ncbi:hypothetical protein CMI37_01000 [Candidatus Pacearchaeota archaeon]|nr:hypothetical protein [Candidatus Pacearchaeota archaeon]
MARYIDYSGGSFRDTARVGAGTNDEPTFRNSRRATQMRSNNARALRSNPISRIWSVGAGTNDEPTIRSNSAVGRVVDRRLAGGITQTAVQQLRRAQTNALANKEIVFTNGEAVSFSTQSMRFRIVKVSEQLKLQDYYVMSHGNHSLNSMSQALLNSLSIRTTKQKKNFTLINSKNDNETIQNPAIIDPDINSLTPDPIQATDKFQNPCDPFYYTDNDDNRTESQKVVYEKLTQPSMRGVVSLANKISSKTLSVTQKKNKFFMERTAYARSNY